MKMNGNNNLVFFCTLSFKYLLSKNCRDYLKSKKDIVILHKKTEEKQGKSGEFLVNLPKIPTLTILNHKMQE